ncbi:hypothetical protein Q7A53_01785 [Halobacillus rhizosphaerae]|uniref:hypothetical protein n=1 Tax=Halobacillus rhizosphaerae TaxID=3064889 RepID=UPI00398B029D
MKKNYFFLLNNERGVIFPFVCAIVSLLIVFTIFASRHYKNEIYFTDTYRQGLVFQSLFEVAHEKLSLMIGSEHPQSLAFSYHVETPSGNADATCTKVKGNFYSCKWDLVLTNKKSKILTRGYPAASSTE